MNLLNEDNVVHIALNKIGDIVIANLLFVLCSLPLITAGPALTALYHCMLRTAAVGMSLRYETKVIEPVGEPSNTT